MMLVSASTQMRCCSAVVAEFMRTDGMRPDPSDCRPDERTTV